MESGRTAVVERAPIAGRSLVVGLDLAGGVARMALEGISSIITTRADHLGRWLPGRPAPMFWVAPDALDAIAVRESGRGATADAVVAIPAWFGALDRAAVRALLGAGRHSVRVVSSPSAAAVAWAARQRAARLDRAVLCVDVGHGVSGTVVLLGAGRAQEVASVALEPGVGASPGSTTRPEVLTALVGQLLRRARAAGVELVDAAVLAAEVHTEALADQWHRVVVAATRPGDVAPAAHVLDRGELVADGAARLVGRCAAGESCGLVAAVGHRLGVLVDDGANVRVMVLVDADRPLPSFVDQLFAVDASADVRLDLVEARRPGAGDDPDDWSLVAGATWTGALIDMAGGSPTAAHVVLELSVDSDGAVAIGPADSWSIEVAAGAVEWSAGPISNEGAAAAERAHRAVDALPDRPVASPAQSPTAEVQARSIAWPGDGVLPGWPPPVSTPARSQPSRPTVGAGPGVDVLERGVDAPPAAAEAAAAIVRDLLDAVRAAPPVPLDHAALDHAGLDHAGLDHAALEEIARAEVGGASLATALVELERQLSKRFGLLVGVRSVPALLDCDDDADLGALRAGAMRLEQALDGQPDGDLTEAVRAAVRAARRAFGEPMGATFVGGTAESIAADAVRVAEHLRLVVGDVVPAERQRIALDARLRGLSLATTERVLAEVLGGDGGLAEQHARSASTVRDATARVGVGHRGWSLEAHADPGEATYPESRPGVAQIRVLLLERCLGVL